MAEHKRREDATVILTAKAHNIKSSLSIALKTRAVYYYFDVASGEWREVKRTEIADGIHPEYNDRIQTAFFFSQRQEMKLVIYDVKLGAVDMQMSQYPVVAETKFVLTELVNAVGRKKNYQLYQKDTLTAIETHGTIELNAELMNNSTASINFTLRGDSLPKVDTFGSIDSYVVIECRTGDVEEKWIQVYKTEVIKNKQNCAYRLVSVPETDFCFADRNRPIRFSLYDRNAVKKDELIGQFQTSVTQIQSLHPASFVVPNKYNKDARLVFEKFEVVTEKTALEVFEKGHIQLHVVCDFSAYNGNPTDASSLHFCGSSAANPYQSTIEEVSNLLINYDKDQHIGLYGIAATLTGQQQPSNFFNLAENGKTEVDGVAGAISAYNAATRKVTPANMCYLADAVNFVAKAASDSAAQPELVYHVMLILTAGKIQDMSSVTQAIVAASSHPLSVLIVGLGNGPFDDMKALDGDDGALRDVQGNIAHRDIVQFVEKKKADPRFFLQQLLSEIPLQVSSYLRLANKHF